MAYYAPTSSNSFHRPPFVGDSPASDSEGGAETPPPHPIPAKFAAYPALLAQKSTTIDVDKLLYMHGIGSIGVGILLFLFPKIFSLFMYFETIFEGGDDEGEGEEEAEGQAAVGKNREYIVARYVSFE